MPVPNNISDDDTAMDYLRRLNDYRTKHGLSMRQLAKVIKRAPSTICAYENFWSIPDASTYNALADFFHWPRYCPQRNTATLGFMDNCDNAQPADNKKRRAYSIPANLLDDIRDIAAVKGRSMSEIITAVLEEYTAKHKGSLLAIRELRNS